MDEPFGPLLFSLVSGTLLRGRRLLLRFGLCGLCSRLWFCRGLGLPSAPALGGRRFCLPSTLGARPASPLCFFALRGGFRLRRLRSTTAAPGGLLPLEILLRHPLNDHVD